MEQFGNITDTGKARITSKYGPRNIGRGASKNHKGIDIGYRSGTNITSPLDGVVEVSAVRPKCGGMIVVNHGKFNNVDLKTKYCHVKRLDVKQGEIVKKGKVLGLSGGAANDEFRGNSQGAHIHFEVFENGVNVNPEKYYTGSLSGNQSEIPNIPQKTNGTFDFNRDSDNDENGDDYHYSNKEYAKNFLKDIISKVFSSSSSKDEVVNEIFRYKELMLENSNTACKGYESIVPNCQTAITQSYGVTIHPNGSSDVKSPISGQIKFLTDKKNFDVAIEINGEQLYWKGSINKSDKSNVAKTDSLGNCTGYVLYSKKQNTNSNNTNTNQNPNQSQPNTNPNREQAKDIIKGIISNSIKPPTPSNESIDVLKNKITEEIKMFNRLIK